MAAAHSLGKSRSGKGGDGERGERPAAHRVDVGQRVGRGDRAVVLRVVHHRREEVHRLHERRPGRSGGTPRRRRRCVWSTSTRGSSLGGRAPRTSASSAGPSLPRSRRRRRAPSVARIGPVCSGMRGGCRLPAATSGCRGRPSAAARRSAPRRALLAALMSQSPWKNAPSSITSRGEARDACTREPASSSMRSRPLHAAGHGAADGDDAAVDLRVDRRALADDERVLRHDAALDLAVDAEGVAEAQLALELGPLVHEPVQVLALVASPLILIT